MVSFKGKPSAQICRVFKFSIKGEAEEGDPWETGLNNKVLSTKPKMRQENDMGRKASLTFIESESLREMCTIMTTASLALLSRPTGLQTQPSLDLVPVE